MKVKIVSLTVAVLASVTFAQSKSDAFLKQQAYNEMMRVSRQMDVLETNFNRLSERVSRLENGGGEVRSLKAEIDALKAELNRLRAETRSQRKEIVSDIVTRISTVNNKAPAPAPTPAPVVDTRNYVHYEVQAGDTLSLISKAFGTTVYKLKTINNLKSDSLRIGQKLMVPMPKTQK